MIYTLSDGLRVSGFEPQKKLFDSVIGYQFMYDKNITKFSICATTGYKIFFDKYHPLAASLFSQQNYKI